jgi:heme-degrading monooxygenase HmoA
MKNRTWHLAQINVARMIGDSIDHPTMKNFVAQLDEVNSLAEASPGFVWRLKDEANNATNFNPYNDNRVIVNMSVWETLDDLKKFIYSGRHADVLRSRRDWFVNFGRPFTAMWYIPAGHIPTVEEAMKRLELLQLNGPTASAFDFKTKFTVPS